jgi:hypothetical protein
MGDEKPRDAAFETEVFPPGLEESNQHRPQRPRAATAFRPPTASDPFATEVFPAELEEINQRRDQVRKLTPSLLDGSACRQPAKVTPRGAPSTKHGLVGLALSGGGIRSAAFSLGVLQALDTAGIFAHIDYLSTVSGGGWIGSCLSALMHGRGAPFPFSPHYEVRVGAARDTLERVTEVAPHNAVLEHLHDHAAALVPSGFVGGMGMLSRVVRGSLFTVAMFAAVLLLPSLALAMLVQLYLSVLSLSARRGLTGEVPWSKFVVATPWVFGVSVLLVVLMPVFRTLYLKRRHQALANQLFAGLGAVCLAVFAFEVHVYVTWWASHRVAVAHLDFLHLLAWLVRRLAAALSPGPTALVALGVAAAAIIAVRTALARVLPLLRLAALALVAAASVVPIYLFVLWVSVAEASARYADSGLVLGWRSGVIGVSALGALFLVLLDTNEASLHTFFRSQIARLFIVKKGDAGAVKHVERVRLSKLSEEGSVAPYHLLNAALNLQGSKDRSLRGRNADFFVFSKRYVGGRATGYCRTEDLERVLPDVDLAAAMTISAAAAAPNMGTYTLRPVVLLMAFLNLRLGYWLLNPDEVRRLAGRDLSPWERLRAIPTGRCYFRELLSAVDAEGPHVYLSDGGHLENTGAFELLRRRCRYVIVCDAEEDPAMHFGGIAALMRYARLDLGVEIELSLDDLAPDARGISRQHWALGGIRYPAVDGKEEELGTLLYIKSSVTSDEHPVIGQYRALNPLFPHESTADQAFGEAQFEAYRALGEHITRGLAGASLRDKVYGVSSPVKQWFDLVETRVAPPARFATKFSDLRHELEEVDSLLRAPELAGYFAELYPELAPPQQWAPIATAVLHEVAMRQVNLIASVCSRLEIDGSSHDQPSHRGWIQLFRRWMASPNFRRVWIVGSQSYGPWLQRLCDSRFGHPIGVTWTPTSAAALGMGGVSTLPPAATPGQGALFFRCDASCGSDATVEFVAGARLAVTLASKSATLWQDGARARPGFDDLVAAQGTLDALERALVGLGLRLSSGRDATPSTVGAEAREWLEKALAEERAAEVST